MEIIPVQVFGDIDEMTYFYADDDKNAAIIDPGAQAEKLKKIIEDRNLKLKAILITHGHVDHIGAAEELSQFFNIPIYMGINGKSYVGDPKKNISYFASKLISFDNVTEKSDGEIIEIGSLKLKVLETHGHTLDSVTYYDEINKIAFVGDTIFEGSYGRTDFFGGNEETLFKSIKEKIFALPNETKLFSGHSNVTTVAIEKTRSYYR